MNSVLARVASSLARALVAAELAFELLAELEAMDLVFNVCSVEPFSESAFSDIMYCLCRLGV